MNRHTCYCYGCGENIKEAAKRIKALEQRVIDLELQNKILHKISLEK
jgi:hypothetical protein|tara:strand:- start:1620 stop:1760 length:141 start_codon:yes stop_codon:yes gene_type:complete